MHFIKYCTYCAAYIGQCRCPGPKNDVRGVCQSCYELDDKNRQPIPADLWEWSKRDAARARGGGRMSDGKRRLFNIEEELDESGRAWVEFLFNSKDRDVIITVARGTDDELDERVCFVRADDFLRVAFEVAHANRRRFKI